MSYLPSLFLPSFLPSFITYLLAYLLYAAESFLRSLSGSQLIKKFPAFYGTRRFITALTSASHLSISWASSIQSMPPHSTSWKSILILPCHERLGLPSGIFPSGFPTKTLYTPLFPSHVLHAPPISLCSIWSLAQYWVSSTDHYAPHYVVFSTHLLPRPSKAQIFSSTPYFQTPSAYVPPSMWATKFHTHTKQQACHVNALSNVRMWTWANRPRINIILTSGQSHFEITGFHGWPGGGGGRGVNFKRHVLGYDTA